MLRYFRRGLAIIRGLLFQTICIFKNSIKCGNKMLISKGVEIRARNKAAIDIGNRVSFGAESCISALNGGHIYIGNDVSIGSKSHIVSHDGITIGEGTLFAQNIHIYDHDHKFDSLHGVKKKEFNTAPVVIGKNCWIGANTIILRGTEIGDNSVVGAGSILKGKYPGGSLIVQPRETVVRPLE